MPNHLSNEERETLARNSSSLASQAGISGIEALKVQTEIRKVVEAHKDKPGHPKPFVRLFYNRSERELIIMASPAWRGNVHEVLAKWQKRRELTAYRIKKRYKEGNMRCWLVKPTIGQSTTHKPATSKFDLKKYIMSFPVEERKAKLAEFMS